MNLTPEQHFQIERLSRIIDAEQDIETLRKLCKETLIAWQMQRSCTNWAMRQGLQTPPHHLP